ncbi:MAG: hypothetical protein LBI28_11855 [Treponema sp.]|jgi:hypothetical protein|nr:hypothetical protein [Treponema sp.]
MKKIAGKIAMILILVMLANSFSGCTLAYFWFGDLSTPIGESMFALCLIIDACVIGWVLIKEFLLSRDTSPGLKIDKLSSMEISSLPETEETLDSLPSAELIALTHKISSLPETELNSLLETASSFSETERAVFTETFNSLSQTERASSIERLNSLPEAELVSLMKILQHIEVGFSPDNRAYLGVHFRY